ncbi:MAG: NADH-quinone oxidoreductase subunit M [Rhodospirillaceae bacterium]|nr:NADH-quinone oxidoreductase subunit M [Rhodospirillaceae bacterium]MEA4838070.1 NADH-quinone oxidoreductase subunit M [Rhodospirillaceae bacterium]
MDFAYPVLSSLIWFPLAAAVMLFFIRDDAVVRKYTLVVGLIELALAFPLTGFQSNAAFQFVERIAWVPQWGLEYHLAVDGISILLVWITLFTLPLCVLCSWKSIQKRVRAFHACLLIMTAVSVGIFTALDLVLFYVFWEAMIIPFYLFVAVWGEDQRRYASIKYVLYAVAGSALFLVAIVAFRIVGGTFSIPDLMNQDFPLDFQILCFIAMALTFAVKAPLVPVHGWLPTMHMQAPAACSVLLGSLKMGTYGFIRFCLPLAPAASDVLAPAMIVLAIISIIYGGAVALAQSDVKKIIAYSTICHMGFVVLGLFLFNQQGAQGAMFQMVNQGIITGSLFLMIGVVYERSHSRDINKTLGMGKYMPAFMFFWGLFSLASFGFPGTNGFVGEILIFVGGFKHSLTVGLFLVIGGLLSTAYMFRIGLRMAWGAPSTAANWKDLARREWAIMLIPAVMVIYLGLAPSMFLKMITPATEGALTGVQQRKAALHLDGQPTPSQALASVAGVQIVQN